MDFNNKKISLSEDYYKRAQTVYKSKATIGHYTKVESD